MRKAENEALEKQVKIEELESQVKYFKKFECLLE